MRCGICSKGLNEYMVKLYTCKCGEYYCRLHMHGHGCRYNYHAEQVDLLRKALPVIIAKKIIKINDN